MGETLPMIVKSQSKEAAFLSRQKSKSLSPP